MIDNIHRRIIANFPFNGQIGEFICKAGIFGGQQNKTSDKKTEWALMATKWNIGAAKTAKARGRAAGNKIW